MTNQYVSLMEVTGALSSRAAAANFEFGEDTAIVAVQHMLRQTVDLFEAVVRLGVRRQNIFALGKVYSNSTVVIETLRARGINVVESTPPQPGQFDPCFKNDVHRLWQGAATALSNRRIKRILVLDDGGRCIDSVPRELLRQYEVCAVEQTSLGIFRLQQKPPPFAVMSWARSAVKLQLGGPIFSQCLLAKVESEFLRGQPLAGEELGIIGLGSIGSGLANLAERQHNKVIFYDPDSRLQIPHYLQGRITRVDSLEALMMRCNYVFGCSGHNPFQHRWPVKYRPGIKLFSVSGGDHEFGPIISDLKSRPGFNVAPATWDIYSNNGSSGPICIAYLGYPYNFVSRAIEAVPTHIVQLEAGGLLAGLIQARAYLALYEKRRELGAGFHRITPALQRFVYETWLTAMKSRYIDLQQVYGFDPAMLEAARTTWWFGEHSESHRSLSYGTGRHTEMAMARMVEETPALRFSRQPEARSGPPFLLRPSNRFRSLRRSRERVPACRGVPA